jgi:hypothetical protein
MQSPMKENLNSRPELCSRTFALQTIEPNRRIAEDCIEWNSETITTESTHTVSVRNSSDRSHLGQDYPGPVQAEKRRFLTC